MLYKHWKKVLLSVTAFFWASCDDPASSNTSEEPASSASINQPTSSSVVTPPGSSASTEGVSSTEANPTSSATDNPASSEAAAESSDTDTSAASSSDNPNVASSGSVAKSSSDGMIAPKWRSSLLRSSLYRLFVLHKHGIEVLSVGRMVFRGKLANHRHLGRKVVRTDGIFPTERLSDTIQAVEFGAQQCSHLHFGKFVCLGGEIFSVKFHFNQI